MQQRYSQVKKVTLIGAFSNLVLAIVKVIFGCLGHSSALMVDGVHSFSDLLTDAVVLLAAKYGAQSADDAHPYGHARIETFASLLLASFLIFVGLGIGWNGIEHLIQGKNLVVPHVYVVWIAAFSVVVNEVVYRYTLIVGKKVQSDLLIANALHSRSDAAASLIVLVGVIGSLLGYVYLDKVAAVIVALMILRMGAQIGWNNIKELIDTGLEPEQVKQITQVIMSVSGVKSVHELRTRRMAGRGLLDAHIIVDGHISVSEGHHIAEHVMCKLRQKVAVLEDVVVHIDSENDEQYSSTSKLPMRIQLLPELQTAWQGLPGADKIADIRMHYLSGSIDLEVVLPLSILNDKVTLPLLQQQYDNALKALPSIRKITLYFR